MINKKKNLDSSGFSLVSAIVTLAVCGAGMAYITEKSSIGLRNQTNIQTELDRFVITRQLQTSVDCVKSFDPAATCPSGGNIKLFNKNNIVIVSDTDPGTKMGGLTVKAECNADHDGLIIKAARLSSTGTLTSAAPADFVPNPLNGKTQSWTDPKALLLPLGTNLCPSFGVGGQSADLISWEQTKPWGTQGGKCASTGNNWQNFPINTETSDISNSLSIDSGGLFFKLQPGVYECIFTPTISKTGESRVRLWDDDNGVAVAYGQSMRLSIASPGVALRVRLELAVKTKFKLQVQCRTDGTDDALGIDTKTKDSFGNKVPETFTQAKCRKYSK